MRGVPTGWRAKEEAGGRDAKPGSGLNNNVIRSADAPESTQSKKSLVQALSSTFMGRRAAAY